MKLQYVSKESINGKNNRITAGISREQINTSNYIWRTNYITAGIKRTNSIATGILRTNRISFYEN